MRNKRLAILSGIAIVGSMLALTPVPARADWAGGGGYHGGESGGYRGGSYPGMGYRHSGYARRGAVAYHPRYHDRYPRPAHY